MWSNFSCTGNPLASVIIVWSSDELAVASLHLQMLLHLHTHAMKVAFFPLNSANQCLLGSYFCSKASTACSAFNELKKARTCPGIRLWIKKKYGWFDLPSRWLTVSPYHQESYFLFHCLGVQWSTYHLFPPWKNFFVFTVWLFGAEGLPFSSSQHSMWSLHNIYQSTKVLVSWIWLVHGAPKQL